MSNSRRGGGKPEVWRDYQFSGKERKTTFAKKDVDG